MGYIGVIDKKFSKYLAKIETSFKGEWCICISRDEYLGLGSDGPRILSIGDWVERLRSGLIAYAEKPERSMSLYHVRNDDVLVRMLNVYIKMGKIDRWGFFPQKGYYSVGAEWTEDKKKSELHEERDEPIRQVPRETRILCPNCGR